jgi:N-acetylmuramoyl-L-alanine amidase
MVKIAGCAGHGLSTPGKRTPDGEHEWSFNNKVILAFENKLKEYEVEFRRMDDRTGKVDIPLKARTDGANKWGADAYVSFHHNANTGSWGTWTGSETFTYIGENPKSEALAKCVHPKLVGAMGLKDRGMKKEDFHIVREFKGPAILTEAGYMDSSIDIIKLRDDLVMKAEGEAVAEGFIEYFKLKKKVATASIPKTYRVTTGTFANKLQADAAAAKIKKEFGYVVYVGEA